MVAVGVRLLARGGLLPV